MKRILFKIFLLCAVCICIFQATSSIFLMANLIKANASSFQYARITSANAKLYKTATENNNISNVICYLEETYFVEVLLNFNTEFYKVAYKDCVGYALKSNLELVKGEPKTPFPTSKITTINSKCYLRSSPEVTSTNSNTICVIPANCNKLNYIGKALGDEVVDYKGTTWYFVEYLGNFGYVYNNYVANVSTIYQNFENLEPLNVVNKIINPLSTPKCAILIIIISLPCLFILVLLYTKPKLKQSRIKESKAKIQRSIKVKKQEEENL